MAVEPARGPRLVPLKPTALEQPARPAQPAQPAQPAPDVVGESSEKQIRPFDTLHIAVFQEPDLTLSVKVSEQGTIRFPLLGTVQVGGLRVSEAEKKLTELLERDYLVNPKVTITGSFYTAKRRFVLLGQVKSPGSFEIPEQETITLVQAIAQAGGFTDIAASDRVTIIRTENGDQRTIRVNVAAIMKSSDKTKDVELKPGDVIQVPETFF